MAVIVLLTCFKTNAQSTALSKEQYQAITYSWTDANGVTHDNVPITERATDPRQIYELLRTIYCDPRVPGTLFTGYGNSDGSNLTSRTNPVYYGDTEGGWKIKANPTADDLANGYKQVIAPDASNEGYTALIVGVKNSAAPIDMSTTSTYFNTTEQLINYIGSQISDVELLTDGMRVGLGTQEAGTVFNISGTYNKFFFLVKGQSRKCTSYESVPFKNMFEEFSPTDGTDGSHTTDFYWTMLDGQQYPVLHDCSSVLEAKHYFAMAGQDESTTYTLDGLNFLITDYRLLWYQNSNYGKSGYTRDGRDMNTTTNTLYATYAKYNPDHQPETMLYNIHLNATRSDDVNDNGFYTVTLNWESSLDRIRTSADQLYYVYEIVTDHTTGTTNRHLLDILNEGEEYPIRCTPADGPEKRTLSYKVPQEMSTYALTYIVTAQPDPDHLFRLTESNEAQVIIPGSDKLEALQLTINGHYESEYKVDTEVNHYNNYVNMSQGQGVTQITPQHLNGRASNNSSGTTEFKLYRYDNQHFTTSEMSNGETRRVYSDSTHVATLKITKTYHSGGYWSNPYYSFRWEIVYAVSSQRSNPGSYPASSGSLSNITSATTPLNFGTLQFCDRFEASTSANAHPSQYSYKIYFDAASSVADGETHAYSNLIDVPVYKSDIEIDGLTFGRDEVIADDDHHLEIGDGTVALNVQVTGERPITRYDIMRGLGNAKPAISNAPQAAALHTEDGGYQPQSLINNVLTANGNKIDYVTDAENDFMTMTTWDVTPVLGQRNNYVPVVRVYRPDGSTNINTYGAPLHSIDLANFTVNVRALERNEDSQGSTTGYKAQVTFAGTMPDQSDLIVKKYRLWRMADMSISDYLTATSTQGAPRRAAMSTGEVYVNDYADQLTTEGGEWLEGNVSYDALLEGGFDNEMLNADATVIDVFRARNLNGIELPVTYIARVYIEDENGNYYVIEQVAETEFNENIVTSVDNMRVNRSVSHVTYYNATGVASMTPHDGLNIVVTRYTDGTTATTKRVY